MHTWEQNTIYEKKLLLQFYTTSIIQNLKLSNYCKQKYYVAEKHFFFSASYLCWVARSKFLLGRLWCLHSCGVSGALHATDTMRIAGQVPDADLFSFFISFFFIEGMSSCNGISPVKKGTDDPKSHQELNHQGQVDFPYETCSKRMT